MGGQNKIPVLLISHMNKVLDGHVVVSNLKLKAGKFLVSVSV